MCIKLPPVPTPSLPSPLTLGVGVVTPPVGLNANLCCKLGVLSIAALPIGVPLSALSVLPILGFLTSMRAYVDSLAVKCPLE